jgi:Predicted acyltransferases
MGLRDEIAEMTKLPERNLDLLRAVAVLCVVTLHFLISQQATGYGWVGRAGVLLFFVHTSLVLMGSIERTWTEPNWVRSFYMRRAFRIYPLAIVVAVGMILAQVPPFVPVSGKPIAYVAPSTYGILANLALVQNIAGQAPVLDVLWTLPLELQMYVVLPVCFLIAVGGPRRIVVLLAASVIPATVFLLFADRIPGLWRLTVLEFVPCFLSGVLAYSILRTHSARLRSMWWIPALALALGIYAVAEVPAGEWAMCLFVGLAITAVRELPESWLTRSAFVVAKYSYGIYLTHVPALRITLALLPHASRLIVILVFVAITAALSWLGFHLIERPAIDAGKRLIRRRLGRPALADMSGEAISEA